MNDATGNFSCRLHFFFSVLFLNLFAIDLDLVLIGIIASLVGFLFPQEISTVASIFDQFGSNQNSQIINTFPINALSLYYGTV